MEILYVENENNECELSLKIANLDNSEIKEIIQYEYSDNLESLEQKIEIYKIGKAGNCAVGSKWARLITYLDEDLIIRIDDTLLEEFKQLNLYHIVKL